MLCSFRKESLISPGFCSISIFLDFVMHSDSYANLFLPKQLGLKKQENVLLYCISGVLLITPVYNINI